MITVPESETVAILSGSGALSSVVDPSAGGPPKANNGSVADSADAADASSFWRSAKEKDCRCCPWLLRLSHDEVLLLLLLKYVIATQKSGTPGEELEKWVLGL